MISQYILNTIKKCIQLHEGRARVCTSLIDVINDQLVLKFARQTPLVYCLRKHLAHLQNDYIYINTIMYCYKNKTLTKENIPDNFKKNSKIINSHKLYSQHFRRNGYTNLFNLSDFIFYTFIAMPFDN